MKVKVQHRTGRRVVAAREDAVGTWEASDDGCVRRLARKTRRRSLRRVARKTRRADARLGSGVARRSQRVEEL